ncbi:aminopeptidase P family protein [Candidatus Bipolaricaulota bacterium]|nr:aminopeptidase P family protein [Candidatus Bipolaricaulota bacterium]
MNKRIERLRKLLAESEESADGYLILNIEASDRPNQRYLTGFDSTLGCTLVLEDRVIFLTDSRYIEDAKENLTEAELEKIDSKPVETAATLINDLEIDAVAIDQNDVSLKFYNKLRDCLNGVELLEVDGLLGEIRRKKDGQEIELHEKAADIGDSAFSHLLDFVEPGLTERDVALELEFFMRKNGAESVSFPPIVATGAKSAKPHAHPSDNVLEPGNLLLVDMGARYNGYCSDLTRTVYLGEPPSKVKEIYRIVLEAQLSGLEALGPGESAREVHGATSEVIEEAGYGDSYGHGAGHGVGLDVHEGPKLDETSEDTLEPGMVVTMEPGIYLSGWGGIRIEDMVRITEDGYARFSHAPKDRVINPL